MTCSPSASHCYLNMTKLTHPLILVHKQEYLPSLLCAFSVAIFTDSFTNVPLVDWCTSLKETEYIGTEIMRTEFGGWITWSLCTFLLMCWVIVLIRLCHDHIDDELQIILIVWRSHLFEPMSQMSFCELENTCCGQPTSVLCMDTMSISVNMSHENTILKNITWLKGRKNKSWRRQ